MEREQTEMMLSAETLGKRLREARLSRGFKSAAEAARQFNWNITSYQQAENGTRPPTRDKITEYAQKFHVSVSWLLTGSGTPDEIKTVPFLGHIDQESGALVENDPATRPDVPAPPGATEHTVAIRARGGGHVVSEGALLYFENRQQPATDDLITRLCVVARRNGMIVVRRLEKGSRPGVYDLLTFVEPTVKDEDPLWAAEIVWIRQP